MQRRFYVAWLSVCALIALGLLACDGGNETGSRAQSLKDPVRPEQIEPFTRQDLPDIHNNDLHELHFAGGAQCGKCHLSTEPMPIDHAHEVCVDCHPQQSVAAPVWQSHCLSCHYFTMAAQEYSTDPQRMSLDLCVKCHTEEGFGGHLYGSCKVNETEMIQCNHCHRPHESDAPAAAALCAECHADLSEARHPLGSEVRCGMCHWPHRPPPSGPEICTKCHGQAEDVMVHRIPKHPDDCLVCHEPHFTTIEIKHSCADCHEEYEPLATVAVEGLPKQHLDCDNCHELHEFNFLGVGTCNGCHRHKAAELALEGVPEQHRRCTTCHASHSWQTSFASTCRRCHEIDDVFEHQLDFHPGDCATCHDPHGIAEMPRTGHCGGCHEDNDSLLSFGPSPPEMHLSCANCHDADQLRAGVFAFVGEEASCRLCHFAAADDLAWDATPVGHQSCGSCHSAHEFGAMAVDASCQLCHGDVVAAAPNELHRDCLLCHEAGHRLGFTGTADSCLLCHSDAGSDAPNDLHRDCANCHEFDHGFSFTGSGATCELCHASVLAEAPSELHQACDTCHRTDHSVEYVGAGDSCQLCHSGLLAEHNSAGHGECTDCHAGHSFSAHYDACTICHADREDHFRGYQCSRCHKFGPGGVYRDGTDEE